MYQLDNGIVKISIAAQGAELQSVFHHAHQQEYMWSGDPAFWGKKSPVLFPIVGGLKNGRYQFNGNSYVMGRHGFAREREFTVTQQTENSIYFTLQADAATLDVYPFHFQFTVAYTLNKERLSVQYIVENTGDATMYFSVGAHPAFAVPLTAGTGYNDYYLAFNQQESAGKWPLSKDGLIEKTPISCLENTNRLPLTKELFYGDALVFKQLSSSAISIRGNKTDRGLTLSYSDFPYMGIWSAKDANFVCIEPWCGIADGVDASGEINEKEGINLLKVGEVFTRGWELVVF